MKPPPPGWPRISTALYYPDAQKAIAWLVDVFGFEVRLKIEGADGKVEHSELTYGADGEAVIMVGEPKPSKFPLMKHPGQVGGANTQNMMMYVDDVNAHCEHARARGAKIVTEPKDTDYGEEYWADRAYEVEDLGGHRWWIQERLRTGGK